MNDFKKEHDIEFFARALEDVRTNTLTLEELADIIIEVIGIDAKHLAQDIIKKYE